MKSNAFSSFFILIQIISFIKAVAIECPSFVGSDLTLDDCYDHSGDNPVTKIRLTAGANSGDVCPLRYGEYAWVSSEKQQYSSGTTDNSQIYGKIIEASGVSKDFYFGSSLNNGRKCSVDEDGLYRDCLDSTCQGKEEGESCFEHSECNKELACRRTYVWPYESTCQSWLSSNSEGTDEYDGSPTDFCWYPTAASVLTGSKKGLTKFSAEDGTVFGWVSTNSDNLLDSIENGQYGQGAWAYPSGTNEATCFTIQKITDQADTELESPYECDASDTDNKGRYWADSTNYVEVNGEGGLGDDGSGYCPKPGPSETENYVTTIKWVYENSTGHTLDKNDLTAQTEGGIGNGDEWEDAVTYKFIFDNYPFLQDSTVGAGIKSVFPQSPDVIEGSIASLVKALGIGYVVLTVTYFII